MENPRSVCRFILMTLIVIAMAMVAAVFVHSKSH